MSTDIKAIETVYNGYRFRSRLEARWAVFFDAAGIEYQYEPEGFKLSDGTHYLPDFYLPNVECEHGKGLWVDVKGEFNKTLLTKPILFSKDVAPIAILFSFDNLYNNLYIKDGEIQNDDNFKSAYCFSKCHHCDTICFGCGRYDEDDVHFHSYHSKSCDNEYRKIAKYANDIGHYIVCDENADISPDESDIIFEAIFIFTNKYHVHYDFLKEAKRIAKQARFEHGECGL